MNTENKQQPTLTDVSATNGQYSSMSCEPSDEYESPASSCSPDSGCWPD